MQTQGNHGRRCRQRDDDNQQRVPDIQPQDFDEQHRQPKPYSPIADKRGDHAGFHIQQAAQDRRQHDDDGMKGGDEKAEHGQIVQPCDEIGMRRGIDDLRLEILTARFLCGITR